MRRTLILGAAIAIGAAVGLGAWSQRSAPDYERALLHLRRATGQKNHEPTRPIRDDSPQKRCSTGKHLQRALKSWQPPSASIIERIASIEAKGPAPDRDAWLAVQRHEASLHMVLGATRCIGISPLPPDGDKLRSNLGAAITLSRAAGMLTARAGDVRGAPRWGLDLWTLGDDLQASARWKEVGLGSKAIQAGTEVVVTALERQDLDPAIAVAIAFETAFLLYREPELGVVFQRNTHAEVARFLRGTRVESMPAEQALKSIFGRFQRDRDIISALSMPATERHQALLKIEASTVVEGAPPFTRLPDGVASDYALGDSAARAMSHGAHALAVARLYRQDTGACPASLEQAFRAPFEQVPLNPVTGQGFGWDATTCTLEVALPDGTSLQWSVPDMPTVDPSTLGHRASRLEHGEPFTRGSERPSRAPPSYQFPVRTKGKRSPTH